MPSSIRPTEIEEELAVFQAEQTVDDDIPSAVRVATEYIHDHLFNSELTVTSLRKNLGVTDAMFSVRFRRHHGYTPACYIRRLRVKAAKRVLRQYDDLCIADVAFHVGYEHYRSFARVFKRLTDRSPKAFREQIGEQ